MNGILAFSLSNSVTEVGALAAFAALLGIAILSLLVFSQAREIKRLREWAGRAPERAAEMEQRVSADAAARLRGGGPSAPGAPVRVVPRKTPLVSAPVSTAVNATVAAVVPGATDQPLVPAATTAASAAPGAPANPATPVGSAAQGAAGDVTPAAALVAGGSAALAHPTDAAGGSAALVNPADAAGPKSGEAAAPIPRPADPAPATPGNPAPAGPADGRSGAESSLPAARAAPATAAARAAGASARAPLPPSPAAPAPPGPASSSAFAPAVTAAGSVAAKSASGPPAPAAAARAVPSRAVAIPPDEGAPLRSSAPTRSRADVPATSAGARGAARAPGASGTGGPKYFKPERSPRRPTVLIVGGAVVGVLAIVLAISLLKGGGGGSPTAHSPSTPTSQTPKTSSQKASSAVASNPSETAVVVLNGTSTPGLAHHLASDLQQSGYTLAAASAGVPPGTHATTVVEYTPGHRADAKAVAKALDVTQVQAIDSTIASLAGSATVVVLAGADQASQLGGGGAQSGGEPAVGAGGEGTPAGQ